MHYKLEEKDLKLLYEINPNETVFKTIQSAEFDKTTFELVSKFTNFEILVLRSQKHDFVNQILKNNQNLENVCISVFTEKIGETLLSLKNLKILKIEGSSRL